MQGNAIVFCGNIIADQIKMISRWPDKGMPVPKDADVGKLGCDFFHFGHLLLLDARFARK